MSKEELGEERNSAQLAPQGQGLTFPRNKEEDL